MKHLKSLFAFVCLHVFFISAYGQSELGKDEGTIKQFLSYIKKDGWSIDTIITKYVLFHKEESPVASRAERKRYLFLAVSELSSELKLNHVDVDDLSITSYLRVDSILRTMQLSDDFAENVFVAHTKDKRYRRYFLMKGDKIGAFVVYRKNKAFVLLN